MKRLAFLMVTISALAAMAWLQSGRADPITGQQVLLAYQVAVPENRLPINFTPMFQPIRSDSCSMEGAFQVAAGGEACGCKANQSCCEAHDRCCPSTHPHHCKSGNCYATATEAQADCGNNYEICGVPQ